jgi:hypothetical protein
MKYNLCLRLESTPNITAMGTDRVNDLEIHTVKQWCRNRLHLQLQYGKNSDDEKIYVSHQIREDYLPPRCRKMRFRFIEIPVLIFTFGDLRNGS